MRSSDAVSTIFIAFILVIVSGMAITFMDPYEYWSEVSSNDDGFDYTVGSSGSADYSILSIKNGEFNPPDEIYVHYDEAYGVAEGYCSEETYEDMIEELRIRGIIATGLDSDLLLELMLDPDATGKAVVFITGALPRTIYSGSPDDVFFQWFERGGSVYWIGHSMGKYIGNGDGTISEVPSWRSLFFGEGHMNDGGSDEHGEELVSDIALLLCLYSSGVGYGLSSDIPNSLEMSFVDDSGFSASSLVKFHNGQIGVIGASFSDASRTDLAQMISSGMTYDSEIVDKTSVKTHHSEETGTVSIDCDIVYIFCGGYYSPYGERFTLR